MPLPLIAIGLIGASAAGGGGAGAVGLHRRGKAKEIDAAARRTYANAKRLYTRSERATERAALALGQRKIEVMTGPMAALHDALSLFRHLDFDPSVAHDPMPELPFDTAQFEEIDFAEWQRIARLTAGGAVAVGKAAGTATATSGATIALALGGATASTGTAIGGLSGAAAANATLAWFGGGSLAAGGYGMAGGTVVLGGIAVAPVALVGGLAMLHSGGKALEQARTNERKANAAAAQSKAARALLDGVRDRARWCDRVLADLSAALAALVPLVRSAAERQPDARRLTDAEKAVIVAAFRTSQVVTELVALNIVWRGRLTAKSARVLGRAERFLEEGGD
jgi:hypothetical protein